MLPQYFHQLANCQLSASSHSSVPLLPWKLKAHLWLLHTTPANEKQVCVCLCVCVCVCVISDWWVSLYSFRQVAAPALMLLYDKMRVSTWNCYQRLLLPSPSLYPWQFQQELSFLPLLLSSAQPTGLRSTASILESGGSITTTSDY